MQHDYEILDQFNTSLGVIARLRFHSKQKPLQGKIIRIEDARFEITGVISHSSPAISNIDLVERMKEGIFDCIIKPFSKQSGNL